MTTIALNYSKSLLEGLFGSVNKIFMFIAGLFTSIGKSIQVSRQIEANRQIAKHLLQEYPEHTYESLVAELNHKTIQKEM